MLRIFSLVFLVAVLAVGLPLFVRMPVWVDVTYHDISAKNILTGGIHYRDVFETNLPGMVWVHAILRPVIGWSMEAIRLADLLVVAAIVFLLSRQLESGRVGYALAVALFYLFESEFIHCQRDVWMMLPVLAAVELRRQSRFAVVEGILWGLAVWIKPHVLVPALAYAACAARTGELTRRELWGLLAGGIFSGIAGVAWLVSTGTWGPKWEVLLGWNGEYYQWSVGEIVRKGQYLFTYFPPFSLCHLAAIPLALRAIWQRQTHATLSALYLGWIAQATVIQKPFDYVHAPGIFLALAILAATRWPVGLIFFGWCLLGSLVNQWGPAEAIHRPAPGITKNWMPDHGLAAWHRLREWPGCFNDDSCELKDRLSPFHGIHSAPDWPALQKIAGQLRALNVAEAGLICWHDSTHPLYLELGLRPGFRFPHVITAMKFRSKQPLLEREAFASPARYIVTDLVPVCYETGLSGTLQDIPEDRRSKYPWNQPVVFQAGRYLLHEITAPKGEVDFDLPDWMMK
jgi:hypothetical protein